MYFYCSVKDGYIMSVGMISAYNPEDKGYISGVSLSPVNDIGRVVARYVRLIAEDGMAITNGKIVTECADVLAESVSDWTDCEPIDTEEATEADYLAALERFGVTDE